jgi:hypothetical protein
MDAPVVYLGKSHRVLFHDPVMASIIAQECYPNDPYAVAAANMHIFLDNLCSRDPSFKKYIEKMEILNRKERKPRPRLTKRAHEDSLISLFGKLEEAKRLFRAFYSNR